MENGPVQSPDGDLFNPNAIGHSRIDLEAYFAENAEPLRRQIERTEADIVRSKDNLEALTQLILNRKNAPAYRDVVETLQDLREKTKLAISYYEACLRLAVSTEQRFSMLDIVAGDEFGNQALELLDAKRTVVKTQAWRDGKSGLGKILPSGLAEVNCAEFDVDLPPAHKWQRAKQMPPGVADAVYMRLMQDTRQRIEADLLAIAESEDDDIAECVSEEQRDESHRNALKQYENTVFPAIEIEGIWGEPMRLIATGPTLQALTLELPNPTHMKRVIHQINTVCELVAGEDAVHLDALARLVADDLSEELSADWRREVRDSVDDVILKHLQRLARELDAYVYDAQPLPVRIIKKRHTQRDPRSNGDDQQSVAEYEVPTQLLMPHTYLPWLEEDDVREISILTIDGKSVGLIDARDAKSKDIERETFDYRNDDEIKAAVKRRLDVALQRAASGQFEKLPRLNNVRKDLYPTIRCPKIMGPDAIRLYASQIYVAQIEEPELSAALKSNDVDSLVLWMGTCTKKTQIPLVSHFTGYDRGTLRAKGVGSV